MKTKSLIFLFFILSLLFFTPLATAEEHVDESRKDDDNGWFFCSDCFTDWLNNVLLDFINAPVDPLIGLVNDLLLVDGSEGLENFKSLWRLIANITSVLLVLVVAFMGLWFLFNSLQPKTRLLFKEVIKKIVLILVGVNVSYYLYKTLLVFNSGLTSSVLSLVSEEFLRLTFDSLVNFSLEIIFGTVYLINLLVLVLLLSVRQVLLNAVVVLLPLIILLYFVPGFSGFAKTIIYSVLVLVFSSFLISIVLVVGSKMSMEATMTSFLIVNATLLIVNLLIFYLIALVVLKTLDDSRIDFSAIAYKVKSLI